MKLIKLKQNVTVVLGNGEILTDNTCDDAKYAQLHAAYTANDEDGVKAILLPEFYSKKAEIEAKVEMLGDLSESQHLTLVGKSIYLKSISELSVPEDLATAIYMAEKEGDEDLVNSYLNFWTLASLNPDSRARMNLFWFLQKYGMRISKSGLFVAYRNVELSSPGTFITAEAAKYISKMYAKIKFSKKKNPAKYFVGQNGDEFITTKNLDEIVDVEYGNLEEAYAMLQQEDVSPVYTDSYTRKFRIKIGEPVTMDRSRCDSKQENTCSRGLHVAGKDWLQNNYFGNTSLMVLVNPADVVAVPPEDSYGKMRTCAYYPVQVIERDVEGQIIDQDIEDGFEDDFINKITYTGDISDKEEVQYSIEIPATPEINKNAILENFAAIKESLAGRNRTVEQEYACDYCGDDPDYCGGECEF